MGFGSQTTADEVLDGVDLRGTVAVVTGASSGLGAEVARALRAHGATVVGTARDPGALDGVEAVALDLTSLASVRSAAETILAGHPRIDLLFANAGVMATPEARTDDGFELQLGTNHLGHVALTALLAPALSDARIVLTSSLAHMLIGMRWDDPHFDTTPYDKWQAYGQSKSANILFAKGLAARGFTAYSVHPGAVGTGLMRYLEGDELAFAEQASTSERKTVGQGAATLVWATVADGIPNGSYLADCAVAEPAPHAADSADVDRLWTWSEAQLELRFPV